MAKGTISEFKKDEITVRKSVEKIREKVRRLKDPVKQLSVVT